jgi:hypothetical protein
VWSATFVLAYMYGGFVATVMMIHYSYATLSDHAEIMYSLVLFTVCPDLDQSAGGTRQLSLPPPGLSSKDIGNDKGRPRREKERKERKGKTKGKEETAISSARYSPSPRRLGTSSSFSFRPESSLSSRSLSSFTFRLTVVRRKPNITRVHRSSTNRSRILKRIFPLPVSFHTSAHRIFCYGSHRGFVATAGEVGDDRS